MNHVFTSLGQSIGASASASVLPMNIQDWFPLGLTGLISLQSKGISSLLQHHSSKTSVIQSSAFFKVQLSHNYWKKHSFDYMDLCHKVVSLLFNMLSRFVIAFFPRDKHLNFMVSVTICSDYGEIKICHCFYFFPIYLPWSDGTGCCDLSFWNGEF